MGTDENAIEFLKNQDRATGSFSKPRFISRIKKLAAEYPDQVDYVQNEDGTICAHFPVAWVKITPPRQYTDEQKQAMAANLRRG